MSTVSESHFLALPRCGAADQHPLNKAAQLPACLIGVGVTQLPFPVCKALPGGSLLQELSLGLDLWLPGEQHPRHSPMLPKGRTWKEFAGYSIPVSNNILSLRGKMDLTNLQC